MQTNINRPRNQSRSAGSLIKTGLLLLALSTLSACQTLMEINDDLERSFQTGQAQQVLYYTTPLLQTPPPQIYGAAPMAQQPVQQTIIRNCNQWDSTCR